MAYDEYNIFPPEEEQQNIPLKDVLKNIVSNFENKKNYQEIGEAATRLRKALPGVAESVGRGALAGVPGSIGDLSEFARTYAPEAMDLKFGKKRTFPTTREILDYVPRITDTHEGANTLEDVGSFIGPGVFSVGKDLALATKGMPVGLSMVGPESKLWKQATEGITLENQAFQASKLEAKGKTAEEIYKNTGMVRGLDGQWRSEITDFWSQMKGDKPFGQLWAEKFNETPVISSPERKAGTVLVKDVFDHPELFKHYPELGEMQIKPHSVSKRHLGEFDEANKSITLRENLTPEEARSVLHHELTHGIQGIENWNRGGSPEGMANWIARQGEVKTKMAEAEIRALQNKLFTDPTVRNTPEFLNEWNMAHDKLDKAKEFSKQDPYELYNRLGGEAESRMTQARLGLTQEQLKEHFPYSQGKYGLDIDPDRALMAGYEPGVINNPSQSIDYRGNHEAPANTGDHAPGYDLTRGIYPNDIYGIYGARHYGHGGDSLKMDEDTLKILKEAKDNPDHPITVYRAVPSKFKSSDINPGDWVTPNLEYAKEHGKRFDDYHIIEKTVPAKHIWTEGNSIHEFGYDPTE